MEPINILRQRRAEERQAAMTFSDAASAIDGRNGASAKHENLFIYLILHMILGCRKDNRALATMAGTVTRCGRICRLNEQRQRMESGGIDERRTTVSRADLYRRYVDRGIAIDAALVWFKTTGAMSTH